MGLSPLTCGSCGAAVAIAAADAVVCRACGASVPVPAAHREAVERTRDYDDELARAAAAWRRFERGTLTPRRCNLLALVPGVLLVGALALSVAASFGAVALPVEPRTFLGLTAFVPLPLEMMLLLYAYGHSLSVRRAALTRATLAAGGGEHPTCRACGAPLDVRGRERFVRCPYCRTDSLIELDATLARTLAAGTAAAGDSLQDALWTIEQQGDVARDKARAVGLITAGIAALPIVWAFAPSSWVVDSAFGPVFVSWLVFALSMMALGFPAAFRVSFADEIALDASLDERTRAAGDMGPPLLAAGLCALPMAIAFVIVAAKAVR